MCWKSEIVKTNCRRFCLVSHCQNAGMLHVGIHHVIPEIPVPCLF